MLLLLSCCLPSFQDGYHDLRLFTSTLQMLVDTDGTLKALYKFIKKHANTPFKIERPAPVSEESASSVSEKSAGTGVKEEL